MCSRACALGLIHADRRLCSVLEAVIFLPNVEVVAPATGSATPNQGKGVQVLRL
ncbi:MAG: hypothetical protein ACJAXZ_002095 [Akkermansiaceae bacterium]|jgi:hypothetical protein